MSWQFIQNEASKDKFERDSTEENLRLMRKSVDYSHKNWNISKIALLISIASLIVALIALFK